MRFETRVRLKSSGNPADRIEMHLFEIPIGVFIRNSQLYNCKIFHVGKRVFSLHACNGPSIHFEIKGLLDSLAV